MSDDPITNRGTATPLPLPRFERACPYCGCPIMSRVLTCKAHSDLPALDPFYFTGKRDRIAW